MKVLGNRELSRTPLAKIGSYSKFASNYGLGNAEGLLHHEIFHGTKSPKLPTY